MKINYCPNCGCDSDHLVARPEEYHIGWYCKKCENYFNVLSPAWQD